jgi:hypothetical protein
MHGRRRVLIRASMAIGAAALVAQWLLGDRPAEPPRPENGSWERRDEPREPRGVLPGAPTAVIAPSTRASPPSAPEFDRPEPRGALRWIVRDMLSGEPVPGLVIRVEPRRSGIAEPVTLVTDSDGRASLDDFVASRLACDRSGVRLLAPDRIYRPSLSERPEWFESWTFRGVIVRGSIELEDPGALGSGQPAIVARSGGEKWGRWVTDEKERGSPAWLDRHAGRDYAWHGRVVGASFEIEVPAMDRIALVASAPGHIPEIRDRDYHNVDAEGATEDFRLRKGARARVTVLDDAGRPIEGATVRYKMFRTVPIADARVHQERIRRQAAGTALGMSTNAEAGTAEIWHSSRAGRSGPDGRAEVESAVASDGRVLLVHAPRRVPFVHREVSPGDSDGMTATLQSVRPLVPRYFLRMDGKPLPATATCGFSLRLGFAHHAEVGGAGCDAEGAIDASAVAPGQEYLVIVSDRARGISFSRFGWLTFGNEPVVDISHFEGTD